MDHRQFIKGLTQDQRSELTKKSNQAGTLHLLPHAVAMVVLGILIGMRIPYWPILLLPQGILVVFLFTLLHETTHRTVFRTVALNDWVARVCGLILCLGPTWFRYFHFAHHRHTQDPANDPELASSKPETKLQYLVHVSGIPVWKSQIQILIQNALNEFEYAYLPTSKNASVVREARTIIGIYFALVILSLVFQTTILLWVWLIPALLGQPFLRLYLLAEHADCEESDNMLANTRTTFTTWLVRRLAWNMPYHAEHHAFPTVPFHKLPQLHRLAADDLKETERGYGRFNWRYYRKSESRSAPSQI